MFKRLVGALAAMALACGATAAQAARISPMIVDVTPAGRGTIARIELTNPDAQTFPVEVEMMRGEISEDGELTLTSADDQFLVFPAQSVVQPNSQQIFRVQYVGEPTLSRSEVYYMVVKQIPVALSTTENQVQVVVNFNVLINVVPDGTTPTPVVDSAHAATQENPETHAPVAGVQVRVSNSGTRYFHAGALQWRIAGTGADGQPFSQTIEPTDVIRSVGVGVVAPAHTRIFFVPTSRPLGTGPVTVTLSAPSNASPGSAR